MLIISFASFSTINISPSFFLSSSNVLNEFTWVLIGAVISLLITYLKEMVESPKIKIRVVRGANEPTIHPRIPVAFFHLEVINSGKESSISSDIKLTFEDMTGQRLFDPISAKWDASPEPLGPLLANGTAQYFPSLSAVNNLINIRKDIPETLCIFTKYINDPYLYAFNSDSYPRQFRYRLWRINIGTYRLKVSLRANNTHCDASFIISNLGNTLQDVLIVEE